MYALGAEVTSAEVTIAEVTRVEVTNNIHKLSSLDQKINEFFENK